jgi:hypothetical protein
VTLPAIRDFAREANDPARYEALGRGWFLAVADVEASTMLAGAGRDRDVNFVAGAAVAVLARVATKPPDTTARPSRPTAKRRRAKRSPPSLIGRRPRSTCRCAWAWCRWPR